MFIFPSRLDSRVMRRLSGMALLYVVLICMTIASGAEASSEKPPIVESIRIEISKEPGDRQHLEQIARSLIYLKEGEPFSDSEFSRSIEALKRSEIFRSIDIPDPDWSKERINLVFRLKPYPRIKKMRIHGAFPLLEEEIRNVMTIEVGDPCLEGRIAEQKDLIKTLFLREGYIHPEAAVTRKVEPEDGNCILDVDIDKGPYYEIEALRLFGNNAFSSFRLKPGLSVWQSSLLPGGASRLVEKKVKQDADKIRQFYRKKGYSEAEVISEIKKNPDSKTARVIFTISEGPRYKVSFEGNSEFWDFTLKKDLVLFTEGNVGSLGLRKSIRNMEKRYQKAGYKDVEIKVKKAGPEDGSPDEKTKNIRFVINEGPRYLVESVFLSGVKAFDRKTVMDQMLTAPPEFRHKGIYDPVILEDDIRAINALYKEAGYRDVSISKTVETKSSSQNEDIMDVTVRLDIEEGPQTIVQDVSIKGSLPISEEEAEQSLEMRQGMPFRQYLARPDRNSLASSVSEKGYPHVSVDQKISFTQDNTGANIIYEVDPGPRVEMGEVFFTGNFKTRQAILDREVKTLPGEPFSLLKLADSQRNIRNLQAVDTAGFKIFGLEQKAERVDMLAELREIKPYFVELASGYDTRRLFYMNMAAGDRNLMGLNKELRGEVELSQIGYRVDLDLNEPSFLGTRISAGTNLFAEKTEDLNKDFGTRIYGASQGFSRPLAPGLTGSLNFRYESRQQYRTDDLEVPEEEADEYSRRAVAAVSPGLSYSSTDSYLRPTRGVRASVRVDASRGLDTSIDDFFKYRLSSRYYYTPFNRLTLALRGRLGYIDPYGSSDRVAEDQLFFLGGAVDVRGFSENKLRVDENNNPVGGRTAILASAEARYDLGLNFEIALFYDTGTVRDPINDSGSGDFRESVGLALRYITPIGPIGGMYGWKLDPRPGESPGAFHFSIGYTF
ncbi:MAG: outer membrane protein assembly factor BamA [Desulfosalsimonas sp.]